jgi:hypothetical protein
MHPGTAARRPIMPEGPTMIVQPSSGRQAATAAPASTAYARPDLSEMAEGRISNPDSDRDPCSTEQGQG